MAAMYHSRPHFRRIEGYRYVREYSTKAGLRFALWERQNGRMRRVGTAKSEEEYLRFLHFTEDQIARWKAMH